jgi:hypothetical protein
MARLEIGQHMKVCSTREKGRAFYPVLLGFARSASGEDLVVSFKDVQFVTPSFLHETLAKLLAETPPVASAISIEGLREFPAQQLAEILREEQRDVEIRQTGPEAYRMAALAA